MRAAELARISAATTLSFIIGPSVGGYIYTNFNPLAPTVIAVGCFSLNVLICVACIPDETGGGGGDGGGGSGSGSGSGSGGGSGCTSDSESDDGAPLMRDSPGEPPSPSTTPTPTPSVVTKAWTLLRSTAAWLARPELAAARGIVLLKVMAGFVERSMSSRQFIGYYEERFHADAAHVGYVMSAAALVSFVTNSVGVGALKRLCGGEMNMVGAGTVVMICASVFESFCPTFATYLVGCMFPLTLARCAVAAALESLYSIHVPAQHSGKARSVLGVFMSGVGVLAPSYGAVAFVSVTGLVRWGCSSIGEAIGTGIGAIGSACGSAVTDTYTNTGFDLSDDKAVAIKYKGVLAAAHYVVFGLAVHLLLTRGGGNGSGGGCGDGPTSASAPASASASASTSTSTSTSASISAADAKKKN
jgi:hypothetical protein